MRVSRPLKRVLKASFSSLYVAGLGYWLSVLFLKVQGPFGEEPHALERILGPTHLVAALLFIFVVGMVWSQHVGVALKLKRHRASGWVIFAALALVAASGITILYGSETLVKWAEKYHPWIGASLLPWMLIHWLGRKRLKRGLAR